ncbi:MAG: serine/threonine protein kinase, partial [Acidobacteriota bacterium]|nr:serine/threonine protein kinase [Acidobacteriota bacterium]
MRRHVSLVIRLCLSGMLLAASAWPQSGGEWIVDTIAGGELGDDSPAVQAQLNSPAGVAADTAGNLYIADTANGRIRRVNARGTITTVAGGGSGGDGGPAVQAQLDGPTAVALDSTGSLYIADTGNSSIRRVDTRGTITTIAGTGEGGFSGDGGPAVQAQLNGPTAVALDSAGNLYIADTGNSSIRRVDTRG